MSRYLLIASQDPWALVQKDVPIYHVVEELFERGIDIDELIGRPLPVARAALPELLEEYEQIWQW